MKHSRISFCALAGALAALGRAQSAPLFVPGLTLDRSGVLYVPIRALGDTLGLTVGFEAGSVTINSQAIEPLRTLPDGTRVAPLRSLAAIGAQIVWDSGTRTATLAYQDQIVSVSPAPKRAVIDKSRQLLSAYQGDLLVFQSPISTGRAGYRTPNGEFTAGPYKAKMHYSSLYNRAPMPYSVQIEGNIFVHGYEKVPEVPASHGCIRLPLDGSARFFYDWVEVGTPVTIEGRWQG